MSYSEFINNYINVFASKHNITIDDAISKINNGWCYGLAVAFKTKFTEAEIVRSYNHWFIRIPGNTITYYDAFMSNGTTNLIDITDNDEHNLEVWDINDFYKQYPNVVENKMDYLFLDGKIEKSLEWMGLN